MCGLAGVLVFDGESFRVSESPLVRMRDTMAHRGPDGAGVWIATDARVGLAHRRLSIIDLSASASQPMPNEDGSLRIVFNGEIYNHAEIRREMSRFADETGLLDRAAADRVMTTADGSKVWYLMNLAMWWRHVIAREPLALEEDVAVPA